MTESDLKPKHFGGKIMDGGNRCRIGIGGGLSDRAPATPPGMRVRTGRFEKLRL